MFILSTPFFRNSFHSLLATPCVLFLLVVGHFLTLPNTASAATITVDVDVDDSLTNLRNAAHANGPGCSLREAIDNANKGNTTENPDCDAGTSGADTIEFDGVTLVTLSSAPQAGEIFVTTDILIQGTVAISGANNTRIFTVASSSAALRLSDVTLQNGNGNTGSGGAILANADTLVECDGSTFTVNLSPIS